MTGRQVRTLVTGGVRSGKSRYAERLLSPEPDVRYVAAGPPADAAADPEWAERVLLHQVRRHPAWTTVETTDLVGALADPPAAVLVDCLGTWLTAVVDELDGWDRPVASWQPELDDRVDALLAAWSASPARLVAVTNEVGWGVVPAYPSGRLFADRLGALNAAVATRCDEVVLMVAGRPLRL